MVQLSHDVQAISFHAVMLLSRNSAAFIQPAQLLTKLARDAYPLLCCQAARGAPAGIAVKAPPSRHNGSSGFGAAPVT